MVMKLLIDKARLDMLTFSVIGLFDSLGGYGARRITRKRRVISLKVR